jgi:hypothetical protein
MYKERVRLWFEYNCMILTGVKIYTWNVAPRKRCAIASRCVAVERNYT